jgi:prepilin-type N-terminal cleavage/methylation domain-containing protein
MNKINKQKGFTLIELMVVVGVISLVSSIITYSTSEAKVKAEDSKMIQEAQQVEKAIQLYKNDHNGKVPGALIFAGGGSEPVGDQGVVGVMYSEDKPQYQAAMSELVPEYYPEIPESTSGESYAYMVSSSGEEAVFSAILKKTKTDGSGGSGSRNSCGIVKINKQYGSCYPEYVSSCEEVEYDKDNQECFFVENYCYLKDRCSNVSESKNPSSFPNQLCTGDSCGADCNYTGGRVQRGGVCTPPPLWPSESEEDRIVCEPNHPEGYCGYIPEAFYAQVQICNFTTDEDSVCDGGPDSDQDYCACI